MPLRCGHISFLRCSSAPSWRSSMVLNTFTRRISELERQRADLQVEEDRVFDFLHGLGEAFSEGVSSNELHRLIVESAVRILNAHGGALYLMDKADPILMPAFVSKGCPALSRCRFMCSIRPPEITSRSTATCG